MIVKFSSKTVDSLKPAAVRIEYRDAQVTGLALRVTPSAVKRGASSIATAGSCDGSRLVTRT